MEKLEAILLADDQRLSETERQRLKLPKAEMERLEELRGDKDVPSDAPVQKDGLVGCYDKIRLFRTIFGTPQAMGQAIFFDGIPAKLPVLKPDVMNVHYQDYYSGSKPPADYLNSNPIPFLTVGKETPFLFAVG